MTTKPPRQVKQRYYYIFWSIATLAVVAGQIYVASSYRSLADALRQNLTLISEAYYTTLAARKSPRAYQNKHNKDGYDMSLRLRQHNRDANINPSVAHQE